MKVLSVHDLSREDRLTLIFNGALGPRAVLEREMDFFLQALEQYAGEWMPDVVKGKRQRKYSREAFWKAVEEVRSEKSTGIGLYRTKWPALDMMLWPAFPPLPARLDIWFEMQPLSFFAKEDRCNGFVELARTWASRHSVPYASAHSMADEQLSGAPNFGRDDETTRRDGFDKVYEVCWLNVFGPRLVETVGRERMLSTPAHRVEALPNGSVLLVTWPTAADFASDDARQAQARALVHLRPDLDFDTVLRTLRERSATLAPVEPHFHPDVAPLLVRTLDGFAISERQRRIAELNAWQPPEPEEWRPASTALPPDVEEPERVLEHYGYLAERLVALLHSEVPSVLQETPGSLTDADVYFWSEDFPKTRLREVIDEHAVPAVGAYLGEVLVRHLGGKWIPREKLEESQVLVGQRVWLPFVRAQRYLRSRQSLLDHSLTQLYRVAERHRS